MDAVGIGPEKYHGMKAMGLKGSMVEVIFKTPDGLHIARIAIANAKQSFVQGKLAWLDVKKTKEETRPSRLMHRARDIIESFEKAKSDPKPITKDPKKKEVLRDATKIGQTAFGKVTWDDEAKKHYTPEQLKHATAWAESN